MQPSLLEETHSRPQPLPDPVRRPNIRRSGASASSRASWRGTRRRSTSRDLRDADLPAEVRAAGAEWWSLRAWMEHGAMPYGAERLREAIFAHQPLEIKQHIVNFIAEELRHHEASVRVARGRSAATRTEPRADYFKAVIPKFHDEQRREGDVLLRRTRGEHAVRAALRRAAAGALRERPLQVDPHGLPADPARRGAAHPVRPHHHAALLLRACRRRKGACSARRSPRSCAAAC